MFPTRSTPVANIIFDHYLRILKPAELTLLLVVIRQTIGWINPKTKRRKYSDWISGSQLRAKTGYSRKAISTALEMLVYYQLIKVLDGYGKELATPKERRGKQHLNYAFNLPVTLDRLDNYSALSQSTGISTCVKSAQDMGTFYAQQKKLLQKKMSYHY